MIFLVITIIRKLLLYFFLGINVNVTDKISLVKLTLIVDNIHLRQGIMGAKREIKGSDVPLKWK